VTVADDALEKPATIDRLDQLHDRGVEIHLAGFDQPEPSAGAGEEDKAPINRGHAGPRSLRRMAARAFKVLRQSEMVALVK
jgi:hypothetical protein